MKKIFMIAVMAVVCMTAGAQKMRHGAGKITVQPMIGFSSGYLRVEEETANGTAKFENKEARTGLVIGAEGEYYTTTPWLSVSAALLYQQQGWKLKKGGDYNVDFINIPVLANFYVAKGFALKIGLQPGFVVSADKDIKDDCNTLNLALPVGLSYEFKNGITLDLRGAAAFTKLNKNGDKLKWYNDGGMLTIGYKFEMK
jgi:hypothetical protein